MAETTEFKEKRKLYVRILKHYATWVSLVESEGEHHSTIKLPDGQEVHYMDILDAFEVLPPRQRQAVWLMCIEDLPEAEVARRMNFKNEITPIQQYKNFGIARLIQYQEATLLERDKMLKRVKKNKKVASVG